MAKIYPVTLSQAAMLIENAFREILGYSAQQIQNVSGKDPLERHCGNSTTLGDLLDFIRLDKSAGLPSLSPPCTILANIINSVGLDSTVSRLAIVVSDDAYYEEQTPAQKAKGK